MSKYLPTVAWGTNARNVSIYYNEGVFSIHEFTIDVYPLDVNEPGAAEQFCEIGDYFIDFLGWPYSILEITGLAEGLRLRVFDVNGRSLSEQVNFGPYPNKIGYIYKTLNGKVILAQAQLIKLDSQARDRINNIEKGVDNGGDMNWMGEWSGNQASYSEGDVVTDLAWTMIANKGTTNRPIPYVSPYSVGIYDKAGTDTIFPNSKVFFGNRYNFDYDLVLEDVAFKLPTTAHWTYYDFYLIIDPGFLNKITLIERVYPYAETLGTEIMLSFDDIALKKGTTFDIIAKGSRYGGTSQDDGKTSLSMSYNYRQTNEIPEVGFVHQSTNGRYILIHKEDLDSLVFPTAVDTDTLQIRFPEGSSVYQVLSKTEKTTDVYELQVDPVVKGEDSDLVEVKVTYVSSYVGGIEINYLDTTSQPISLYSGLYTTGNLIDILEVDAYSGIGIGYRKITINEDWDVVAASSVSISSGGGGVGDFPKDSQVELVDDIIATVNVGGVTVGQEFTTDESVRDLLKAIIAPYVQPKFTSFIVYPFNSNSSRHEVGLYMNVDSLVVSSYIDTIGNYPKDCYISGLPAEFPNQFDIISSPQTVSAVTGISKGLDITGSISWVINGSDNNGDSMPSRSFVAYWQYRWYFGGNPAIITDDTSAQTVIDTLQDTELTSGKSNIVTCQSYNNDGSNFTYICYDSSYGDLTKIIQDGALPVLTAFSNLGDFSFTNQNGVVSTYKVYKSNATGAFAVNAELNIS